MGDTQYAFDFIATWDLVEAHLKYTEEYNLLEERVASGGEATLRDLLNRSECMRLRREERGTDRNESGVELH